MEVNIEKRIKGLCDLLRLWNVPSHLIDKSGFRSGCTDYYIKLFYYLFQEYNEYFVAYLSKKGISVCKPFSNRQQTLREIYHVIKMFGTQTNIIPFTQFCTDGYAEKKVLMSIDVLMAWYLQCKKVQPKPVEKISSLRSPSGIKMIKKPKKKLKKTGSKPYLCMITKYHGSCMKEGENAFVKPEEELECMHHTTAAGGQEEESPGPFPFACPQYQVLLAQAGLTFDDILSPNPLTDEQLRRIDESYMYGDHGKVSLSSRKPHCQCKTVYCIKPCQTLGKEPSRFHAKCIAGSSSLTKRVTSRHRALRSERRKMHPTSSSRFLQKEPMQSHMGQTTTQRKPLLSQENLMPEPRRIVWASTQRIPPSPQEHLMSQEHMRFAANQENELVELEYLMPEVIIPGAVPLPSRTESLCTYVTSALNTETVCTSSPYKVCMFEWSESSYNSDPHEEEDDLIARMASICLEDWAEFTDQAMPQ